MRNQTSLEKSKDTLNIHQPCSVHQIKKHLPGFEYCSAALDGTGHGNASPA